MSIAKAEKHPSPSLIEVPKSSKKSVQQNGKDKYFKKYAIHSGNIYMPVSSTTDILPPGYYKTTVNDNGIPLFNKQFYNISEIIRFPNTIVDRMIAEFDTFWTKKDRYVEMGEPHRRGFLLWGPPGGGKTCAVSLIADSFIKSGSVVFSFSRHLDVVIPVFRIVEPERKLMIVIEDIDMLVNDGGNKVEHDLLQLLDGDIQLTNTVIIATTNYPERLPDRISNRPSRFDRVEQIGMPSAEERKIYLQKKSKGLSEKDISKWVKDTEDFTLAHMKELIVAVEVFELDYKNTIKRLNKMREKKESSDDYQKELRGKKKSGFGFSEDVSKDCLDDEAEVESSDEWMN